MKGKHAARRKAAQSREIGYAFRTRCPANGKNGHQPLTPGYRRQGHLADGDQYVEKANCMYCHRFIRQVMEGYHLGAWETEPYVITEFP